jgi:hypothetical protein
MSREDKRRRHKFGRVYKAFEVQHVSNPHRKKRAMQIVTKFGTMWARNDENIAKIPSPKDGGCGVFILFDGSMPMYVGKGNIKWRILDAGISRRRGQLWDHFSWYAIKNARLMHDVEVLMLRILPPNLRSLTRQGGNFTKAKRVKQTSEMAQPITRKAGK